MVRKENIENKLLFVSFRDIQDFGGISNKIIAQNKAFQENGFISELSYIHRDNKNMEYIINNRIIGSKKIHNLTYYQLFESYKYFSKYIDKNKFRYMYLRYAANASFGLLSFLLKARLNNVKILLEIPTYPYDNELNLKKMGLKASIPFLLDKVLRHLLFLFVYKIVTFSDDKTIWKIPCINISNGYIPELISIKKQYNLSNNCFNMIAVAYVQFWHGFDRIIEGMYLYLKNTHKINIHLSIVGNGQIDELKELVNKYKLNDYVTFTGHLSGAELDKEFDKAHVAIGSLGRHRSGLKSMKSLKNVEYAARGIPFVYSENNPEFDNKPYVLKVPADESPLDISDVVAFFENVKVTPEEINNSVSDYTWYNQIKKVINNINK